MPTTRRIGARLRPCHRQYSQSPRGELRTLRGRDAVREPEALLYRPERLVWGCERQLHGVLTRPGSPRRSSRDDGRVLDTNPAPRSGDAMALKRVERNLNPVSAVVVVGIAIEHRVDEEVVETGGGPQTDPFVSVGLAPPLAALDEGALDVGRLRSTGVRLRGGPGTDRKGVVARAPSATSVSILTTLLIRCSFLPAGPVARPVLASPLLQR